jgi:copper homeostasis protein (lipoprotein)
MKLFRIISTMAVVCLLIAAYAQPIRQEQQAALASKAKTMWGLGTWQGTLPCADCSGIITTLTLYETAPNDTSTAIYKLQRNYIDRGSFTGYGYWKILHGTGDDPKAVLYQLDPGKQESTQYYLQVDDNTLEQLDREKKPIQAPMNFKLERIAKESPPVVKEK